MSAKCLVKLLGADTRLRASIELLFRTFGKNNYELSDVGSLILIDGDSVEGKRILKAGIEPYYIIMTVTPSLYDHPFYIEKPIKSQNFIEVIEKTRVIFEKDVVKSKRTEKKTVDVEKAVISGNPFAKFHTEEYQKPFSQIDKLVDHQSSIQQEHKKEAEKQTEKVVINREELKKKDHLDSPAPVLIIPTVAESLEEIGIVAEQEKVSVSNESLRHTLFQGIRSIPFDHSKTVDPEKYCGIAEDIDLNDPIEIPQIYFKEDNYLCGYLIKARNLAQSEGKIAVLELDNDYVFVSTKEETLYTSLPETSLYAIALMPIDQSAVLRLVDSTNELFKIAKEHNVSYYSDLTSMLAKLTLWSSRGRLFSHVDIHQKLPIKGKKIVLEKDIMIPEMAKIDYLWSSKSVSLEETMQELSIAQRYVFSYYCICLIYGVFDSDNEENMSKNSVRVEKNGSSQSSKQDDLEALLAELKQL